ncbi:uncharacterized protein PF3D7_1120000 [Procambarus clarkii]|uniref:uncharacterized protein PF3D7_1120000 n=1 Tax=Procambarus clarkii TaxID=6728 RepID=UPI001E673299|nr:uncharacterized protein LOC123770645 [Procambarus clarkii]XP_045618655.1 uncharacterized protein LOC123770645 [Procambarus clarkii]
MSEKIIRICDPLKVEVDKHEHRLQEVSRKLCHANTHLSALTDLAQRLRFHLEVKKSRIRQQSPYCSEEVKVSEDTFKMTTAQCSSHNSEGVKVCKDEGKKGNEPRSPHNSEEVKVGKEEGKKGNEQGSLHNSEEVKVGKEEGKKGNEQGSPHNSDEDKDGIKEAKKANRQECLHNSEEVKDHYGKIKNEDLHFKFPGESPSMDREFLKMIESLVEGILLIDSETNLGKMARDLQGSVIKNDLQKWRQVVTVLQKYDDQVRRAIEFFERQQLE